MKKKRATKKTAETIGDIACATGKGLFAGLAGTAAMTIVQMIEMKIMERPGSTVPADGLEKVMPLKAPEKKEEKMKLAQMTHFAYGTAWGIPLGLMDQAGISIVPASATHFSAVWGTAMIMLPAQDLAPRVSEWDRKTIMLDAMHHAVYASVAGLTYHAISGKSRERKRRFASFGTVSNTLFNILGLISLSKLKKPAKKIDLRSTAEWVKKNNHKPKLKWKRGFMN